LTYIKFLKLKYLEPKLTIVPTYDLDLLWHTHMSVPQVYTQDCQRLCNMVVNHDDSIADSKLRVSFQECKIKWKQYYNEEYIERYAAQSNNIYSKKSSSPKSHSIFTHSIFDPRYHRGYFVHRMYAYCERWCCKQSDKSEWTNTIAQYCNRYERITWYLTQHNYITLLLVLLVSCIAFATYVVIHWWSILLFLSLFSINANIMRQLLIHANSNSLLTSNKRIGLILFTVIYFPSSEPDKPGLLSSQSPYYNSHKKKK